VSTAEPHGARVFLLTLLSLSAFAGNSLLARLALTRTGIDPATFTSLRLASGAVVLGLLVASRRASVPTSGSWPSAAALFVYAAAFSFAYVRLTAGTGALLLFGAVQATMITAGIVRGDRLRALQWCGLLVAYAGLFALVLPGVQAPPLVAAVLMLASGAAWGVYSLRGRGVSDPTAATTGNFIRSVPFTLLLSVAAARTYSLDASGAAYALASGAITSGLGYVVWYAALRHLDASTAATVQLSVPVLASLGGVLLLGEALTSRLVLAGAAILGGVALVVLAPRRVAPPTPQVLE
jgi:drug/metabolite transporter (DMT)-like permease